MVTWRVDGKSCSFRCCSSGDVVVVGAPGEEEGREEDCKKSYVATETKTEDAWRPPRTATGAIQERV